MKKLWIMMMTLFLLVGIIGCTDEESESYAVARDTSVQKQIHTIDQYPSIPDDYAYIDYDEAVGAFDRVLYAFADQRDVIEPSYNPLDMSTWFPIGFWVDQPRRPETYDPLNYVSIDHFYTSYRLTSYLIRKGHEAIGFIGNVDRSSSIADRYYGYVKALHENSIVPRPKWHINQTVERKKTTMHLNKDELPSAFICHCDAAAQWLYASLLTKDVRIPDDVSVVSFDNTMLCESLYPKLTSIGPKKDEFGKVAYEMMIKAIETNGKKKNRMLIEPRLNVRDSVADHHGK